MEVYEQQQPGRITQRPVIFTLGVFDGVHRGHQHLLSLCARRARELGIVSAALTFSGLPDFFLQPEAPRMRLMTPCHKRRLLQHCGIDILIDLPFTDELKNRTAAQFLEDMMAMLPIHTWVGGDDLHFGRGREGSRAFVSSWAEQNGVHTLFVPRIEVDGESISSTRIRHCVSRGQFSRAAAFLGRAYSIETSFAVHLREETAGGQWHGVALDETGGVCLGELTKCAFDELSRLGFEPIYRDQKRCILPSCICHSLDVRNLCLPPIGVYVVQALFSSQQGQGVHGLISVTHDGRVSFVCPGVSVAGQGSEQKVEIRLLSKLESRRKTRDFLPDHTL